MSFSEIFFQPVPCRPMPTKKDNEIEAAASASPMLRRRWHSMAVFHCAICFPFSNVICSLSNDGFPLSNDVHLLSNVLFHCPTRVFHCLMLFLIVQCCLFVFQFGVPFKNFGFLMSMQLLEMVSDCSRNSAIHEMTGASKK